MAEDDDDDYVYWFPKEEDDDKEVKQEPFYAPKRDDNSGNILGVDFPYVAGDPFW